MKISEKYLRKLIREELLTEQLDHEGIRDVVTVSSKLLSALGDFEANASGQMQHAMAAPMQKLRSLAEDMIGNPASYIDPSEEQVMAKADAAPADAGVKAAKKPNENVMGEVPPSVSSGA